MKRFLRVGLIVGLIAAVPSNARAHALESVTAWPGALPWSFEPWVLGALALSASLYAIGASRLWRHAGRGRGVRAWQVASFAGGWAVLATALVSPLDPLGSLSFSAHMVQHELLMIVAAPLLVLGRPLAVWAWGLPIAWRRVVGAFFRAPAWRRPWRWLTHPMSAWVLHALALWAWHLPVFFDAALADAGVHTLQHSSFIATALLFWWSVLGDASRPAQGIALLSLFTTMVHTGALGALLALSPVAWYVAYGAVASPFGLDALEDQQIGGLIMWVPAGLVYVGCGLAMAARWLGGPRSALLSQRVLP